MNKLLLGTIISFSLLFDNISNNYGTLSVVTLAGAKIKAQQDDVISVKYKRKDCPVCKGKGWYISGDGIAKVNCGYCEP